MQVYAPFSYDAVYIIVDAMKRANSTDPAKVTQWRAYSDGTALEGRPLAEVTAEIWAWLEPACRAAA